MTSEPDLPETDPPAPAQPATEPAPPRLSYYDAPQALIAQWQARRTPVQHGRNEGLPPADIDLKPLLDARVPAYEPPPERRPSSYQRKVLRLRNELRGQPELAVLNANLIVHLRRASFPDVAPVLFRRIWAEHGPALMTELPGRWLISSVITFSDHGETESQRRLGLSMNVLFSLMKLYEYERLYSGLALTHPQQVKRRQRDRLPLGMSVFSPRRGGLDINLLAPIWDAALVEPVVGPLAIHLLERLNADPSNMFRRIVQIRDARRAEGDSPPPPNPADGSAPASPDQDQGPADRQP